MMPLSPQQRLTEIAVGYERVFRMRTPALSPRHVLAKQRVNFTDLMDRFPDLSYKDRVAVGVRLKSVVKKLRKEFPSERWD